MQKDTKPELFNALKFSEYLKARSNASESLSDYYADEDSQHQDQDILSFKELILLAIINKKQSDSRLSKTLREKFVKDCILAMEDRVASNIKFHESIRGKSMQMMVRKQGFLVHLIDEHKASSLYPKCKDRTLQKFKKKYKFLII